MKILAYILTVTGAFIAVFSIGYKLLSTGMMHIDSNDATALLCVAIAILMLSAFDPGEH